jgi:hypothetical protein
MKSMSYEAVEDMLSIDRDWYLERLYKQLKKESDEMKRIASSGGKPRKHK